MMIFFLVFIVLIALVLQGVGKGRSLDTVTADHKPDKPLVEPDEVFSILITLRNKGRWFVPFLRVRERLEAGFVPQTAHYTSTLDQLGIKHVEFTTWLRPRQQLVLSAPVSIEARGRYLLKDLVIFGGDFLGLNEQKRQFSSYNEVVVVPRESNAPKLNDMFGSFMGEMSVNRFILEDPILTLGYREYTGREPMKMISWSQSSRGNGLMVKKSDFTQEPSVSVILNVDTDLKSKEKLLENCFSMTRSICKQLEDRGIKYTFSTNSLLAGGGGASGAASEGLGPRHFNSILEQLGRATYSPSISAEKLLEKEFLRQVTSGRIIITPADEIAPSRTLSRLREAAGGRILIIRASEVIE